MIDYLQVFAVTFLFINFLDFDYIFYQFIVDEVIDNCVGLATHKIGCSVINNYLGVLNGPVKWRLINEIISYAINLAEDPYGFVFAS